MKYLMLKDVCKISMGQSPNSSSYNDNGDGVPFFQGNADFGERYPFTRKWCNEPTKMANPKDILISVRAPIGAINYAKEECCIGRGLAALTPDRNKVSPEYIYWLLKAKNEELNSKGTGSTFKAISRKVLEETLVPDVDFDKQHEYAKILEKIYSVIQNRKKELVRFDDFIKARFIEIFGLPGTDEKGWGLRTLGECCELNPRKALDKRLISGMQVSFVPMTAISENGVIKTSEKKDYDEVKVGFTYFAENDVLFAKITPCMENGKGAVAVGLCNGIGFGSTEFHVLRPLAGRSNPYWLYSLTAFDTFRKDAAVNMTGSAGQRRVPSIFLEKYKIALPPLELQNQFADFVTQVNKSKLPQELCTILQENSLYKLVKVL